MKTYQQTFKVSTPGRSMINITDQVADIVLQATIVTGICCIFLHHTSASLIICENADPAVQTDMETFMHHIIPDNDPRYRHVAEGPDDMPAHLKASLLGSSVTLPIRNGRFALGIWQGIYLCEHRNYGGNRTLMITAWGE